MVIVWLVLRGAYGQVVGMFAFFTALQALLSMLAIRIDDDPWLTRYAPFSILGYKQFLDVVLVKSLVDVLVGTDLSWTRARRRRQRTVPGRDDATADEDRASD